MRGSTHATRCWWESNAASKNNIGRFETDGLSDPYHADVLTDLSGKSIDRARERKPIRELILDLDSSVSETHGSQKGMVYNGHIGCTCYHPLFCLSQSWRKWNGIRVNCFSAWALLSQN